MKNTDLPTFRPATENDTALILSLIKELAIYEKMENEVIATEDSLREWLFTKQKAEVLIGETEGQPVGYALSSTAFPPFWDVPEYTSKTFTSVRRSAATASAKPS